MPTGQRAMAARPMHTEWETPAHIFDPLNAEFGFTMDAAAWAHNAKCECYLTPMTDALREDIPWGRAGGSVWLNPPYGYRNLERWMRRAYLESLRGRTVVCLVPAHTGQPWWHNWVVGKASEIRWIKGKVKFVGASSCAPFPSCIVIYRPMEAP